MATRLSFSPQGARQGQPVTITVETNVQVDRLDVYGYATPDVTPQNAIGWALIGGADSSKQVRWDTSQWRPGATSVTVVGYRSGIVVIHWLGGVEDQPPLGVYQLLPSVPTGGGTGGGGATGSPPPKPAFDLSNPLVLALLAAAGVAVYLTVRARE